MSDTFASKFYGSVYAGETRKHTARELTYIGETGVYPAYAIRITNGIMYLARNSDGVITGFADCMPGHDLDTVYAADELVEHFAMGDDVDIYVWYLAQSPPVNLVPGDILVLSATDGMMMKFSYADGTDITDSPLLGKVRVKENITGSTTANKLVKVHI
jgi:hypothetical protein